jgi:hypothetical protein
MELFQLNSYFFFLLFFSWIFFINFEKIYFCISNLNFHKISSILIIFKLNNGNIFGGFISFEIDLNNENKNLNDENFLFILNSSKNFTN